MPANLRGPRIESENRAKVSAFLLDAGVRGASVAEICASTGISDKSVAFYLRTSEGVVWCGLPNKHLTRWFHPQHVAGVERYRVELASRPKPDGNRWFRRLQDDAIDVVHRAGPQGITVHEVAAQLGLSLQTVNSAMSDAQKDGKLRKFEPYRQPKRYYGLGDFELPKHKGKSTKSRAKPKELHKKPGAPKGTIRKPKDPQQRPVLAQAYPMPRVSAFASAEAIMPKDVKITVCPAGKDHRFTADPSTVERFFSRPDYRPEFIGQGRWSAAVVESRA